jgi:RimJ/RimL family protein N-acetyltransferase
VKEGTVVVAETERLVIRALSAQDVPVLAVALADPSVMRYSLRGVLSEAQTAEFIEWCIGLYRERGYGPWALVEKDSEALAGFCGLSPELIECTEEVQVGYRLAPQFWGRGLAAEAVAEVLTLGLQRFSLPAIAAIVEPEHTASVRVLEKSGFKSFERKWFHGRNVRVYRQWPACAAPASHNSSCDPTGFPAGALESADQVGRSVDMELRSAPFGGAL